MKDIFCVRCAKVTPHSGEVDQNNEHLFTCQTEGCLGFVKFPQVSDKTELESMITAHEDGNRDTAASMVDTREQQTILEEVLSDGTPVEVTATDASIQ